jgi:hypothetical protein
MNWTSFAKINSVSARDNLGRDNLQTGRAKALRDAQEGVIPRCLVRCCHRSILVIVRFVLAGLFKKATLPWRLLI